MEDEHALDEYQVLHETASWFNARYEFVTYDIFQP
jgi:hypothetical protein